MLFTSQNPDKHSSELEHVHDSGKRVPRGVELVAQDDEQMPLRQLPDTH